MDSQDLVAGSGGSYSVIALLYPPLRDLSERDSALSPRQRTNSVIVNYHLGIEHFRLATGSKRA